MAIFNQPAAAKKDKDPVSFPTDPVSAPIKDTAPADYLTPAPTREPARASFDRGEAKESLIAADIAIEGKIEGSGHVRIAGRFKGDVNVQGDLSIEKDAKLNGSVRARKITVAGELEGNIEQASHVDLQPSSVLIGDLKAGSLTVAAGSRMRGQVEFGWEGDAKPARKSNGAESHASS